MSRLKIALEKLSKYKVFMIMFNLLCCFDFSPVWFLCHNKTDHLPKCIHYGNLAWRSKHIIRVGVFFITKVYAQSRLSTTVSSPRSQNTITGCSWELDLIVDRKPNQRYHSVQKPIFL